MEGKKKRSARKTLQRTRPFIRRHRTVVLLSGLLILLGGAGNAWLAYSGNQALVSDQKESTDLLAQLDRKIEDITARKAAEAKAAQAAAAKKTADAAKNGTLDPSASNSKACNAATAHATPSAIDVVVNKKHCMQPLNYVPTDLVTSHGATLSAKAIDAFNRMYAAAIAAKQPFYVTSSYRSYTHQVATYNHWVATSGQKGADTYSARPGYSEHQTGFAFDVAAGGCTLDCFGSTTQYGWFQKHAAEYGFIQRYYAGYENITGYKAEEWHYRYVGVEVAKEMQAKGIKTLEQYWNVSGGDY